MGKFKVGDRVKIKGGCLCAFYMSGAEGICTYRENDSWLGDAKVKFDKGNFMENSRGNEWEIQNADAYKIKE